MIIVKLQGGLGNQMFQYAFGYAMAKKYNYQLKLDIYGLQSSTLRDYKLHLFDINQIATKQEVANIKYRPENVLQYLKRRITKQKRQLSKSYYCEVEQQCFTYTADIPKQDNYYYEGFWQNQHYFIDYKYDILNTFTPKFKFSKTLKTLMQKIISDKYISIHIRRGDYVSNQKALQKHGLCDLTYYHHAINKIKSLIHNPKFVFFSDDINWVKNAFKDELNCLYIDDIDIAPQQLDVCELHLMSLCQHNIIANSTFSWWAAWLNQNPNKIIIALKQWCAKTDLNSEAIIPENWLQI